MSTYKMARYALAHPLDFFYDLRFQNLAKYHQALLLVVIAIIARLLSLQLTGFSYQTREPYQISAIIEATWILVPWLTWAVANWAVSAIIDGEGRFKDVLVSSSFVFVPYILLAVPIALLTKILSLDENSVYTFLNWFMYLWMVFLILAHVKVIHDFEPKKTFWITVLSIISMFIIWFILLLMFGLINQAVNFIISIFKEISFRT